MKRAMHQGITTPSFIEALPDELLLEIQTKVTSQSFHDLYSAKIVCKKFNHLRQHDRIFKEINLRSFEGVNPLSSWSTDEQPSKFFKRCKECNNFEALYTQAMEWYFQNNKSEFRIEYFISTVCSWFATPGGERA